MVRNLACAFALMVIARPAAGLAASTTCPVTAVVRGPDELVGPVTFLLRQRGVRLDPSSCGGRVVRASLKRQARAGHALHIDDGLGRTSDRMVDDAGTAASLIESWVLDEDTSLLALHRPETVAPSDTPVVAESAREPAGDSAWRLFASAELGFDGDGQSLFGGGATGCVQVGGVCLGGRGRVGRGNLRVTDSALMIGADAERSSAELFVVLARPMTGSRFTFMPLVGLGTGWNRVSVSSPVRTSRADWNLRGEIAARAGVRIGAHCSLGTELGASAGHRVSGDPDTLVAARVPPAPLVTWRAGVGIEYAR